MTAPSKTEGVTIRSHRHDSTMQVYESDATGIAVYADPNGKELSTTVDYDDWVSVEDARILAAMLNEAADWLDAQEENA